MRVHHRRPRARCLVLTACALSSAGLAAGCSGGADPATDVTARSATLNAHGKCDGGAPTPCEYQWRWRKAGETAWTAGPLHGPVRAATSEVALHEPVSGLTPDTAYEWQIGGRGDGVSTMTWSTGPSFRTHVAPPVDPSGQPTPAGDLPGFKQVFADDFGIDVPPGQFPSAVSSRWWAYPSTFQDTAKRGTYDCSRVCSVGDGVLRLHVHTEGGVPRVAAPVPKLPGSTPLPPYGIPSGQRYGRYSVRFKADPVPGYKTAWLLWPDSDVWPRDGEIDFPEGDLDATIDAYHHHAGTDDPFEQDAFHSAQRFTSWHTATTEWVAGRVTFLLDGQVLGTSTTAVPDTPMHWVLQTETRTFGAAPTATAQGDVLIDWVSAWRRDTQAPTKVTGLTATATGGKVQLAWAPATDDVGVTRYTVERNADGGAAYTKVADVIPPATSYADTTAVPGTRYWYRVFARDGTPNFGLSSDPVVVTP
jgi:hypothetical protein